jgi:hypothetical protein
VKKRTTKVIRKGESEFRPDMKKNRKSQTCRRLLVQRHSRPEKLIVGLAAGQVEREGE